VEELKAALDNYSKKDHKDEKYQTREEVVRAYSQGKIFIFKGKLGIGGLLAVLILWSAAIFFLIIPFLEPSYQWGDMYGFLTFFMVFFLCMGAFPFLIKSFYLVIGPQGFLFRKLGRPYYYPWAAVEGIKDRVRQNIDIKLFLRKGGKKKFDSKRYRLKEFPFLKRRTLFIDTFYIYWQNFQNR